MFISNHYPEFEQRTQFKIHLAEDDKWIGISYHPFEIEDEEEFETEDDFIDECINSEITLYPKTDYDTISALLDYCDHDAYPEFEIDIVKLIAEYYFGEIKG